MPAFDSRRHGVAKRKQIGTLQQHVCACITRPLSNSILREASANGSCTDVFCGSKAAGRITECSAWPSCDVDRQSLRSVGDAFGGPWPGCFPRRKQEKQFRIGYPGGRDVTVVFIHGNLASKDWIQLAAPLFPSGVRVIGIDWRGCGESDRPPPGPDFANYSMRQHALDMTAALDELRIPFCHLATHSTGGIIAARMLLKQPGRFGRVFALDPVTPLGMSFTADQVGLFRAMMMSREVTRAVMATAAASLFVPESLAPNTVPRFREGVGELQAIYETLMEQTFDVSEGIWLGTPFNLNLERESGELERRMPAILHPHLVLWGERDGWIAPEDLRTMASAMPDCRLVTVPGIGHSMNLESPALYAGYFGAWFGGL